MRHDCREDCVLSVTCLLAPPTLANAASRPRVSPRSRDPQRSSEAFTRLAYRPFGHWPRDGRVVSSLRCMNDPQPEGHMAHRTTKILGDARRRSSCVVARGARAAWLAGAAYRRAHDRGTGWEVECRVHIDIRWASTADATGKYAAELVALAAVTSCQAVLKQLADCRASHWRMSNHSHSCCGEEG